MSSLNSVHAKKYFELVFANIYQSNPEFGGYTDSFLHPGWKMIRGRLSGVVWYDESSQVGFGTGSVECHFRMKLARALVWSLSPLSSLWASRQPGAPGRHRPLIKALSSKINYHCNEQASINTLSRLLSSAPLLKWHNSRVWHATLLM